MSGIKPIRAKRWSADQRQFMVWLASPMMGRIPTTQKALAEKMGHDESTLSDWKRVPGFAEEVAVLVDQYWLDDYPEIVEAFKSEAKKGSYNHQRTYFEMVGKYTPRQEITGKDGEPLGIGLVEVVRAPKNE